MEVEEVEEFPCEMKLLFKESMWVLEGVDEGINALFVLPCDDTLLGLIQEERNLHLVNDTGVRETIWNDGFPLFVRDLVLNESFKELYFSVVDKWSHDLWEL